MLNSSRNSSTELVDFIFFIFLFNIIETNIDIRTLVTINVEQMQGKESLTRPETQQLRIKQSSDEKKNDN